jgi:hypothetical protein
MVAEDAATIAAGLNPTSLLDVSWRRWRMTRFRLKGDEEADDVPSFTARRRGKASTASNIQDKRK